MIKSSEDANKYYQLINQYIDEYTDKWKINPNNLKNYLIGSKSKLVNFLERKGLNNIDNINKVVEDIIEDRVGMYNDKIIKFESFKILESNEFKVIDLIQCLYKAISSPTIEHEKIVADYFDVSLSHIDIISPEKHIFEVDSIGKVVIYTKSELIIIKENIKNFITDQVFNKSIKLDLGSSSIDIDVNIKDFIDVSKFSSKIDEILTTNSVKKIISSILGCDGDDAQIDYFIKVI